MKKNYTGENPIDIAAKEYRKRLVDFFEAPTTTATAEPGPGLTLDALMEAKRLIEEARPRPRTKFIFSEHLRQTDDDGKSVYYEYETDSTDWPPKFPPERIRVVAMHPEVAKEYGLLRKDA